ncbi:MAG: FMN-binding protein [Treponema sp.]|jgi:electron transport complex protein RnfG|nr:FMN-binding protein [Treponema sp.]
MKVWDTAKLGLVLMLYAAAACVGLAFVYTGTRDTIEERSRLDLEAALKELFPGADGFEDISGAMAGPDGGTGFEKEYAVSRGGNLIGAAIQASGGSYGGPITVLVGIKTEGRISRVRIMSHSDTPGLGANAASPSYYVDKESRTTFYGQFTDKAVNDPFEPKNDVIAITASTITSRAVSRIVKTAGEAAARWLAANATGAGE